MSGVEKTDFVLESRCSFSFTHCYFFIHQLFTKNWVLVSIFVHKQKKLISLCLGLPYFSKLKSGHRMANCDVTKFFGLFNFWFVKSGTLRCGFRLEWRRTGVDFNTLQEIGVISKKKKGHHLLQSTFFVISKPKCRNTCFVDDCDLFLEITQNSCNVWRSTPVPRHSNLKPHLTVPLLLGK